MRKLYLVGMHPPKENPKKKESSSCANLKGSLVALDPRHGVFPNLVMTPIMGGVYYLKDNINLNGFLGQIEEILSDDSARRFNVFAGADNTNLRITNLTKRMLAEMNPSESLWVVFGYDSICGLIAHLADDQEENYTQKTIRKRAVDLLVAALGEAKKSGILPFEKVPSRLTPRAGIIFRLCTDGDDNGDVANILLQATTKVCNGDISRAKRMAAVLRSCIPLLHNDAYQNVPIGSRQNYFMNCCRVEQDIPPPKVYWRYCGEAIARRILA